MSTALTNPNAQILQELAHNADIPTMDEAMQTALQSVRAQAARDILQVAENSTYSEPQIRSMFYGAVLRRAGAFSYVYFKLVHYTLSTIRDENLAQVHPADYTDIRGTGENAVDRSFLRMANEEAGISESEASDIMALGDIIIPALAQYTEWTEREIFQRIKKTNLRAMVPVLRVICNELTGTDERQPSQRVLNRADETQMRWAADELQADIEVDANAMRDMDHEDREAYLDQLDANRRRVRHWLNQQSTERRVAGTAAWLLDRAETMPTGAFRTLMNPSDETPVEGIMCEDGGLVTVTATMTPDVFETWQRVLRERASFRRVQDVRALLDEIIDLGALEA